MHTTVCGNYKYKGRRCLDVVMGHYYWNLGYSIIPHTTHTLIPSLPGRRGRVWYSSVLVFSVLGVYIFHHDHDPGPTGYGGYGRERTLWRGGYIVHPHTLTYPAGTYPGMEHPRLESRVPPAFPYY